MGEKKNLRKLLREMNVGETMVFDREEFRPTTVKTSAYFVGEDYGRKYTTKKNPRGIEIQRLS